MPMTTIGHLLEILTEMFSLERVDSLPSEETDPLGWLGAKSSDRVDFRLFVEERFSVRFPEPTLGGSTLQEMADYIDAMQPSTNPH